MIQISAQQALILKEARHMAQQKYFNTHLSTLLFNIIKVPGAGEWSFFDEFCHRFFDRHQHEHISDTEIEFVIAAWLHPDQIEVVD